jgi:hypothetical protein
MSQISPMLIGLYAMVKQQKKRIDILFDNPGLGENDQKERIENAPKAFLGLFKGENFGKMIVKIGPDSAK